MSDADTSDEEDEEWLREAVDQQFTIGYSAGSSDRNAADVGVSTAVPQKSSASRPTWRREGDDDDGYNAALGTTPEFRRHVAKKLARIMDSKIKEVDRRRRHRPSMTPPEEEEAKTADDGIRLFASSNSIFSMRTEKEKNPLPLKKQKQQLRQEDSSSDSDEDRADLESVAVSGEWVLSKKGLFEEGQFSTPNDDSENNKQKSFRGIVANPTANGCPSPASLNIIPDGALPRRSSVCRKKKHKDSGSKKNHNRNEKKNHGQSTKTKKKSKLCTSVSE